MDLGGLGLMNAFLLLLWEWETVYMQYAWHVQSLTFLAAVDFIVFHHEFFELAQQSCRLLPKKKHTNTQNQHRPYPLAQV